MGVSLAQDLAAPSSPRTALWVEIRERAKAPSRSVFDVERPRLTQHREGAIVAVIESLFPSARLRSSGGGTVSFETPDGGIMRAWFGRVDASARLHAIHLVEPLDGDEGRIAHEVEDSHDSQSNGAESDSAQQTLF